MILRELFDLLNSGEAVSIVGSGVSAEAGVPTWNSLFNSVADALDGENNDTQLARAAAKKDKFPEAFELLAKQTTRLDIHQRTAALIGQVSRPGTHHTRLADWPFRFHITTNYDHLIENASSGRLVPVGNRGSELHKVIGGSRDFVWHVHGGCRLGNDSSQLVVTKSDYDDFYPNSNMAEKLKAILTTHRCVFVGFGFNDEDFISIITAVSRLGPSGRPSFAFIGYENESDRAKQHQHRLRTSYNVEVVPYFKQSGNHEDLHRVLEVYTPFIVRTSTSSRQTDHGPPTYDPVASSLRIQSSLDIGTSAARNGLRKTLVGARVIAHIRTTPEGGCDDDLEPLYRSGDPTRLEVLECVDTLRKTGTITPSPKLDLTREYWAMVDQANAQLGLTTDQCYASLRARVIERNPNLDDSARKRVTDAALAFLSSLCRMRGLGVAQNLATSDVEQASQRTVSLVQNLPEYFDECATDAEKFALVHLVADILTRPSEAEATFLGFLCQAYFGQHLVGASETLARVDLDLITSTCYVLDASVLVCLLSEGGDVHEFSMNLIRDLVDCGAILTTTSLFLDETAEHARWAAKLIDDYGEDSHQVIDALGGRGGYRRNEFLRGYFLGSPPDTSFAEYLRRMLEMGTSDQIGDEVVANRLKSLGIRSLGFDEWEGFGHECFVRRDEVQKEINRRRSQRGTYKHYRQTQAEAEVAIIVDGVRGGKLHPPGEKSQDAFFLSSTRVVDRLPNLHRRICIFPDGLAQWLWSSQATSRRHAELVFQQLLWELAQGGVDFVDHKTLLRRFSGIIEVARADLTGLIRSRREYLIEKYGPNPTMAFQDADPLDYPRLATEVNQEAFMKMDKRLSALEKRARTATEAAKISDKDRDELERLRADQRERQRKAEKKRRAAQSRTGKKRRRRKKKR